jgi:hypothetical protein
MAQPNAKWYDEATLEEMHEDLGREYLKTLDVIQDRPMLLKHFKDCPECQTHRYAYEARTRSSSVELQAHRRRKLILLYSELHAILGLKPEQTIGSLEIKQDPMTLSVLITGPNEPMIPVEVESPISRLSVQAQ